ncbi:hypothetical protein KSP40_PGU008025 [Platanthera guangdongensis]|uniref:Uncharacterized protein n=1 Tax=Platanthera guangdongensis TaxID=2320717 RepID=A0ABR2N556_9ASPA
MDTVLLQSSIREQPSPDLGRSSNTNYDLMLRESIKQFLAGIHRAGFDFAGFSSVISRQLHSIPYPPLELFWLYAAANYHGNVAAKNSRDRIGGVRHLLQFFSAFSSARGISNCVALIAPAVYALHECAVECGLGEKKAMQEIQLLAEEILSYISICSGKYKDLDEISTGLHHPCFVDLVKVWTLKCSSSEESLKAFFPLVSSEVWKRFELEEECGVGYLAGVVIAEAFLLTLYLKVKGGGASRKELQKELRIWAVSSITALHNQQFFEIMLKLLLDPKVTPTTILTTVDEEIAREILYDAVILPDYSFLSPGRGMDQHDRTRGLLVGKLVVTNKAIKIAREKKDHDKALSYLNGFSSSSLPSELIKCVLKEIGNANCQRPHNNSPQGLLKWLVHLEQLGRRIFGDEASRVAAKLTFDESAEPRVVAASADAKMDADLFFFDRGESNDGAVESMDAVFSSAAHSMTQFSSKGKVKRKGAAVEARSGLFKIIKYDVQNKQVEVPDLAIIDKGGELPSDDDDIEEST